MEIIKGLMILQQFIDPVIACAKVSLNRKALEDILKTGTIPDGLPKNLPQASKILPIYTPSSLAYCGISHSPYFQNGLPGLN